MAISHRLTVLLTPAPSWVLAEHVLGLQGAVGNGECQGRVGGGR